MIIKIERRGRRCYSCLLCNKPFHTPVIFMITTGHTLFKILFYLLFLFFLLVGENVINHALTDAQSSDSYQEKKKTRKICVLFLSLSYTTAYSEIFKYLAVNTLIFQRFHHFHVFAGLFFYYYYYLFLVRLGDGSRILRGFIRCDISIANQHFDLFTKQRRRRKQKRVKTLSDSGNLLIYFVRPLDLGKISKENDWVTQLNSNVPNIWRQIAPNVLRAPFKGSCAITHCLVH